MALARCPGSQLVSRAVSCDLGWVTSEPRLRSLSYGSRRNLGVSIQRPYIILNIKHNRPELYRILKKTGLLRITFYLNLYDIVLMLARKS